MYSNMSNLQVPAPAQEVVNSASEIAINILSTMGAYPIDVQVGIFAAIKDGLQEQINMRHKELSEQSHKLSHEAELMAKLSIQLKEI